MGYETHRPLTYCPLTCEYRVISKHQRSNFRTTMFCERYRHPLYRDRELGKKTGRNIQPVWCNQPGH